MTVSASIPIAVLAITIFRALSQAFGTRRATILENNIVQTTGSAGESIAFGVGATMPALMLLGYDMDPFRVMLVSVLGGILGILMMIPLRRAFIVKQHGTLPYPEGTACAKILIAGEQGGTNARTVFAGFGLAFLYQILMEALQLWTKEPSKLITGVKRLRQGRGRWRGLPDAAGRRLHHRHRRPPAIMVGGGSCWPLVLIPAISYFGQAMPGPLPPGLIPIGEMGPGDIFRSYVRYIGAGAVAAGGIISMLRAAAADRRLGRRRPARPALRAQQRRDNLEPRTEHDLPMSVVVLGSLALVAAIAGVAPDPDQPRRPRSPARR